MIYGEISVEIDWRLDIEWDQMWYMINSILWMLISIFLYDNCKFSSLLSIMMDELMNDSFS